MDFLADSAGQYFRVSFNSPLDCHCFSALSAHLSWKLPSKLRHVISILSGVITYFTLHRVGSTVPWTHPQKRMLSQAVGFWSLDIPLVVKPARSNLLPASSGDAGPHESFFPSFLSSPTFLRLSQAVFAAREEQGRAVAMKGLIVSLRPSDYLPVR